MKQLSFLTPCDGDMLSNAAGTLTPKGLEIEVLLDAEEGLAPVVNGVPARWDGTCYRASIVLDQPSNSITATAGWQRIEAVVYWLKHAAGKFAVSSDDNIWAFADLNLHKDTYTSIFDNPYLRVYWEAHRQYGAKVRLNLFYSMDNPCGLEFYGPFDLSMMTDRYKEEFRANAHWLHLAFHANSEFPDNPYAAADGNSFRREYEAVIREIRRFAGEEVIERATTNHWGSGTRDVVMAEKELGIDALMGYLDLQDGEPFVSYYLSDRQVVHANEYGFWKDHETGMIFGKIDAVLNLYDAETACAILAGSKARYPKKGFIEVMIHEQYFYPSYPAHLPDFAHRVLSACRWCREQGYEPAFVSDVI